MSMPRRDASWRTLESCWRAGNAALRIRLGSGSASDDNPACFANSADRATAVFDLAFSGSTTLALLARDWLWRRQRPQRSPHWMQCLDSVTTSTILQRRYQDPDHTLGNETRGSRIHESLWFGAARAIDARALFMGIAHTDFFRLEPRVRETVFLIDVETRRGLHVYDDRGLMLVTPSADDGIDVPEEWILETKELPAGYGEVLEPWREGCRR